MEALANEEAFREMLMRGCAGEDRRWVMRRRARGVAAMPDEIVLRLHRIGAADFGCRGQNPGPFTIEIDQLLRHRLPLGRIGMQQAWRALLPQHRSKFPAEIE